MTLANVFVCLHVLSLCLACRERFEAPEPLFNPSLVDVEKPGLGDMVFEMIQKADMDCRPEYYKHIVLSGGTSMYPGFSTRLESDIRARYVKDILKVSGTWFHSWSVSGTCFHNWFFSNSLSFCPRF